MTLLMVAYRVVIYTLFCVGPIVVMLIFALS